MEAIGVREFRENLSEYLDNGAPVAISRHGETVGYYVPVARKRTEQEWAEFDRMAARIDRMISDLGLTEDEIIEDFKKWRVSKKRK